jgi:hypothetical protein
MPAILERVQYAERAIAPRRESVASKRSAPDRAAGVRGAIMRGDCALRRKRRVCCNPVAPWRATLVAAKPLTSFRLGEVMV